MKTTLTFTFVAVAALVLAIAQAAAQPSNAPQITASVFASGGGTSSGGGFTFTHTLGEPIAGTSSGGGYTLVAGFWAQDTAEQTDAVDLQLAIAPSPVVVTENIIRNFTLTVSNRGTATATGAQLTVQLPAGLRVEAAANSAGTCQVQGNSNVVCSVASLDSNGAFAVSLTLRATPLPELAGEFENLTDLLAVASSSEPDLNPTDNALALPVTVFRRLDWSDARGGFPVTSAEDGACHHYAPGFFLGQRWDSEGNGVHSLDADWDDSPQAGQQVDDEDGVTFLAPVVAGATATVIVNSSFAGFLDAWADFNNDSDWADTIEQIFASRQLIAGNNTLTFTVPAAAMAGNITTRWRASTTGGLNFTGYGGKGEVEDHMMRLRAAPLPGLNHSGGVSTITFQTEAEVNYVIEYSDSLSTPTWIPLLHVAGTGGIVVVTDGAASAMRFYRVGVE